MHHPSIAFSRLRDGRLLPLGPLGRRGGLAGSGAIDAHAFTIKVAKEEEEEEEEKKQECGRPTEYNNGGDSNMACAKRGEARR